MEFNNNVNATFWRNLIDESSPMIDEAYKMASWYAGTSRMKDTEALNIVVYEDGKVNILCSKNSENRERQDIDKDYFENHKAYMVISRISKYSPYDNWIFNDYDEMREVIYSAIENENLWDELSKTIGDKNTIDELSDQQFIDAIKNNQKISDIVCDYLAKAIITYGVFSPYSDISDLFLELDAIGNDVFVCSNHLKLYSGISGIVFSEYNNFRLICKECTVS